MLRRTGLQRGGPLARSGFLSRGTGLARRTPIKERSAKPRVVVVDLPDGIGEGIAKGRVSARSCGWCEIQIVGCFGRALDWHHRLREGQGGLWQASNGLHACRWCHIAVTNTNGNRVEYEANGWMVASFLVPAEVPVLLPDGRRVLLDDTGLYLPLRGAA